MLAATATVTTAPSKQPPHPVRFRLPAAADFLAITRRQMPVPDDRRARAGVRARGVPVRGELPLREG
eukprot:802357-Rhodomonas_salina.6